VRSLIAPHESGNIAHLQGLERGFSPFTAVALCAVSLIMRDLLTDLGHFSGKPASPVDHDYEYSHQNLS
jgi:hypothetical protein